MQTITKSHIKKQLQKSQGQLKHNLGQNYLVSSAAIQSFLSHMDTSPTVIEIGPGIGNITLHYFKNYSRVILIELDKEKIPLLKENLQQANDGIYPDWIEIINADVLTVDFAALQKAQEPFQIIGALPYNISKQIVRKVLTSLPHPTNAVFILQREVADKYVLQPHDNSLLSIATALYATAKRHEIIKKSSFVPIPRVDSRILSLSVFTCATNAELKELINLNTFVATLFQYRRKKLTFGLSKNWPNFLTKSIPENIAKLINLRPQDLSVSEWEQLYVYLHSQTA